MVDHAARLEMDHFDPYFGHLMLRDGDEVVGVYRVMRAEAAARAGGFYTAGEYDLTPLLEGGRELLELGRSCVHAAYRGGPAVSLLWAGLADYVERHGIEVLFGTASFHGTDVESLAPALSLLHHRHLAPEDLRVRALPPGAQEMNLLAEEDIDRRAAMLTVPALIKGYLRLGGFVGAGAWIDRAFNTTDVCLVMDTARLSEQRKRLVARGQGA